MRPTYFDEFTDRELMPRSLSFRAEIRSPLDDLDTVTVTERADHDEAPFFWEPVLSLNPRVVPEVALTSVLVMWSSPFKNTRTLTRQCRSSRSIFSKHGRANARLDRL